MGNDTIVVGVTGFKRHGKDSVANHLVENYGFVKYSFANPLKDTCAAAFGIPRADFDDDVKKELPCELYPDWTLRKILQIVGTELFRSIWPNIWIDRFLQSAGGLRRVVIPDVRFINEEAATRQFKGFVIRVEDPRKPPNTDLHQSEMEIPRLNYDHWINNDGTLDDLASRVDYLAKLHGLTQERKRDGASAFPLSGRLTLT